MHGARAGAAGISAGMAMGSLATAGGVGTGIELATASALGLVAAPALPFILGTAGLVTAITASTIVQQTSGNCQTALG